MEESKKKKNSQGTRLVIVLAIIGLVAAAVFVVKPNWGDFSFESKSIERVPVFGGWDYALDDQRKASVALAKSGLSDYEWNEGKLYVPSNRRGDYEKILGENQAFPQKPSDIKQEAMDDIGAFEPESRTKFRDLYSSARQLEKTLESFDRIESASVGPHSRREQSGLHQRTVVTATISIKTKENRLITPELISAITMAARHHLGITDNADVSVIDATNGRAFLGSEGAVGNLALASYSQEQLRQESLWRDKFLETFGHISGIRVATTINLAPIPDSSGEKIETTEMAETIEAASEPIIEPVKRNKGLLFQDEDPFSDEKKTETKTGEKAGYDRYVRFRPQTIAVSIAVPESYVRKLCGRSESANGIKSDSVTPDEMFRQKSDEVIRYIRETASTLLTPLVGNGSGAENANLVEVALYADLPPESERLFYPNETAPTTDHPVLVENETIDQEMEAGTWQAFYRQHEANFRLGFLCAFCAFFAGFILRSLMIKRRIPAVSENKSTVSVAVPLAEKENPPVVSSTVSPVSPAVSTEEPSIHPTIAKKGVSPSETSLAESVKADRERELARLFDDLSEENDDEVIGPECREEIKDEDVLFSSSCGGREAEKNYRIESENREQSVGPHFPLSAIQNRRREKGTSIKNGFSYAFKNKATELHVPNSLSDSTETDRFQFLLNLTPDALRALLIRQRPQTIALIARSLSETARQQLLSPLGNRFREEVERRIRESDDPDEKVLAAVEATLRTDLTKNDSVTSMPQNQNE